MSGKYLIAALLFIGAGVLVMSLLNRLLRRSGSAEQSASWDQSDGGDGDGGD